MISEEVFRDKITSVIKKIIGDYLFFKHFEDFIKAVFIDHGDKFIVFSHSKAKADMAGGFQYPNKIYLNKAYVEKEIAKYEVEYQDRVLKAILFSILKHELRHFIQCVVMIELCDDIEEAEKCWKYFSIESIEFDNDPLEQDVYQLEHAQDKTIEEFYDFIKCLIEDYRKSLKHD